MSNGDKWLFGFVTLWIFLCAGNPDVLDAIVAALGSCQP